MADINRIDAEGATLVPGFIEVHIQGAGGADVLDSTEEALSVIAKTCARHGVTGFLATTVYRPAGNTTHLEIAADCTGKDLGGAALLGIHLEGPFIAQAKRGMIQPDCIGAPSMKVFDDLISLTKSTLSMLTLAPELDGCAEIVKRCASSGIVVSLGHTCASFEQAMQGFSDGITHVTHFFNAMPSIHHRNPGPVIAILQSPSVSVQVIPDGVHLDKNILKFVYDTLGSDRFVTITDGIQALGLPDGKYVYNSVEYVSRDGAARYHDGTLIGTALGQDQLLNRLIKFTGATMEDAIKTLTLNPARVLGIDNRKGSIAKGKDADLVLLDQENTAVLTMVNGRIVFDKRKNG